MSVTYLKKATLTSTTDSADVQKTVQNILNDIEAGGNAKALEYAAKFDNYNGNIMLTRDEIEAAKSLVPEKIKQDIAFAHDNVRRFAEAQKSTLQDVEIEIVPGLIAGQKTIPVDAAGCYIPGGPVQPYSQRDYDCYHR